MHDVKRKPNSPGHWGAVGTATALANPHGAPELSGEISFQDMVRVNGHIAGTVHSEIGTLLVDVSAIVNAHVDVAVALINGTVMGDIVALQRVELGSSAKVYGNILTQSIEIKPGAIFEGICTMLTEERITG